MYMSDGVDLNAWYRINEYLGGKTWSTILE